MLVVAMDQLGLPLQKMWPDRTVHMIDVNLRALQLTKDNSELNEINNVNVYESDRLDAVNEHKFAAILTNPPIRAGKKVVHDIFEQSYNVFYQMENYGLLFKRNKVHLFY